MVSLLFHKQGRQVWRGDTFMATQALAAARAVDFYEGHYTGMIGQSW